MKIAIFTDIFLDITGGIKTSIEAQRRDLERLGHEVYIFCPGRVRSKDARVRVVPTMKHLRVNGAMLARRPSKVMPYVREELRRLDVDVVHVHYELSTSISGMKVAREMGLPLVQTMHGREDVAIEQNVWPGLNAVVSWVMNRVHGRFIPHSIVVKRDDGLARTQTARNMWEIMVNHAAYADEVVVPTEHFAKKFRKMGLKKQIVVVSNGVEDEKIKRLSVPKVRKMVAGEPLRLVWFSRLSREKRPIEFLDAVRKSEVAVELEMYGDGNQEGEAQRYVVEHGMKGVKVLGRTDNAKVMERLQWAHMNVMNSYGFDTQGMTLLEGVATGLPALFVDKDMREVMPKGSYVCAKSPEVDDMADALRDICAHPEKVEEMSRVAMAARKNVLQSRQTEKLLKVYKDVTKSRTRRVGGESATQRATRSGDEK